MRWRRGCFDLRSSQLTSDLSDKVSQVSAKTLVIAEKPSVGRDLAGALPGSFAKHEGYLESDEPRHHLGGRPSRRAGRARGLRRALQALAHGRSADRARGFQAQAARLQVAQAARRRAQAAQARRRRGGHQRLRRRARGRADLRLRLRGLPQGARRQAEAGRAPVDLEHDQAGDSRRLRAPAPGRADGLARGCRALALGGGLAGRDERHPRRHDPRPRLGGRRRLARTRADADAGDDRRARARDPGLRPGALLARPCRVSTRATRDSGSRATRRG